MKIKEARRNKNLTQKELAEMIGVNFSIISRYENETIVPPANRILAIADALGVSVDYLIGKSNERQSDNFDYIADESTAYEADADRYIQIEMVDADRYEIHKSRTFDRLLAYSRGICELCGHKAPFNDKEGNPYLEIHYIQWLSKGGEDIPQNSVVLCPNCHHKVHVLNNENDIIFLKEAAKKHQ